MILFLRKYIYLFHKNILNIGNYIRSNLFTNAKGTLGKLFFKLSFFRQTIKSLKSLKSLNVFMKTIRQIEQE